MNVCQSERYRIVEGGNLRPVGENVCVIAAGNEHVRYEDGYTPQTYDSKD